jgi:hypothetical protein
MLQHSRFTEATELANLLLNTYKETKTPPTPATIGEPNRNTFWSNEQLTNGNLEKFISELVLNILHNYGDSPEAIVPKVNLCKAAIK